jgi:hypothetical protein
MVIIIELTAPNYALIYLDNQVDLSNLSSCICSISCCVESGKVAFSNEVKKISNVPIVAIAPSAINIPRIEPISVRV